MRSWGSQTVTLNFRLQANRVHIKYDFFPDIAFACGKGYIETDVPEKNNQKTTSELSEKYSPCQKEFKRKGQYLNDCLLFGRYLSIYSR